METKPKLDLETELQALQGKRHAFSQYMRATKERIAECRARDIELSSRELLAFVEGIFEYLEHDRRYWELQAAIGRAHLQATLKREEMLTGLYAQKDRIKHGYRSGGVLLRDYDIREILGMLIESLEAEGTVLRDAIEAFCKDRKC